MNKYPQSYMTVHEYKLFEALKKMHACLNNRILGSGANPSENENFRMACHEACTESRSAIESIATYYDVSTEPAWPR